MTQFLYRQTARGHDMVQLFDDFDAAWAQAKQFVGEHDEVDGCSTKRNESHWDDVSRTWRLSSSGQRRATVRPIYQDRMVDLD